MASAFKSKSIRFDIDILQIKVMVYLFYFSVMKNIDKDILSQRKEREIFKLISGRRNNFFCLVKEFAE